MTETETPDLLAAADARTADAHADAGRLAEAEAAYRAALSAEPGHHAAKVNLAGVLLWQERYGESAALLENLLAEAPDDTTIAARLALVRLAEGDLSEGWRLYEAGLLGATRRGPKRFACPRWDGTPMAEGTLLIWREQGLGDEIRFASCYAEALARAPQTVIAAETRLIPLFQAAFPEADIRPADRVDPLDPAFTAQIPAGSLPGLFRPTLESFPSHAGYLRADPSRVLHWRRELAALGGGLKVGFSWRSGRTHAENRQHSTTLDDWVPLLAIPGARFVSLQYDGTREELADLRERTGMTVATLPGFDPKLDLDDLAAVLTVLDLTISIGNSTADLAGALGVPCWETLAPWLPDLLGTDRLPWYPATRVFAKHWDTPWPDLIADMAQALTAYLAETPASTTTPPANRNAPCPCGSGKRYKHCCGRGEA